MNKKSLSLIIIIILAVVGLIFWAIKNNEDEKIENNTTTQNNSTENIPSNNTAPIIPTTTSETVSADTTITTTVITEVIDKAFIISGSNFTFSPKLIRVKKGDKVKITFKNLAGTHDFIIDEFNVNTGRIADGEETIVKFVADKTGTFEFYCSVGQHRQMGMKGSLIVE